MAVPDLQDALDCLEQKEVGEAIALLEKKIDELPAHLTAHVLLARAFESKKEWKHALRYWENAHFLMPNSPVAREGKERVLKHMDQPSRPGKTAPSEDAQDGESPPASESPDDAEPLPSPETPADDESAPDRSLDRPPTPSDEGPSSLDELRRQTEEESRRSSARSDEPEAQRTPDPPGGESAEERVEEIEEHTNGDLDRLIENLESARIDPDPNVEDVEPEDLPHETEDLVSETLARIYEAQDQFRQAAQIYVKLASQEPEQARSYLERAAEMREKAEASAEADD